jgi:zinc and cadmium transporter
VTQTQLVYGLSAAAANIVGAVAVTSGTRWSVKALDAMLAFAAGFLICVTFIDLFPEAIVRGGGGAAITALVAYLLVHLTQHIIGRHFHFGEEVHAVSRSVSVSALAGLMLHTFVDGVAVASGVMVNGAVGALVFVGVLLHKFPEGLAISSLFLAAGASRAVALSAASALATATLIGAGLTDVIPGLRSHGLAISAGVTLYVGASNLVPELQRRHGWTTPISFFAGCGAYFAARAAL